jgi:transcriptional regulator with PAS, ATPase and Fis domain
MSFLDKYNKKYSLNKEFSAELMDRFMSYDWPGNIRELRIMVERLVITSNEDVLTSYKGIDYKMDSYLGGGGVNKPRFFRRRNSCKRPI